MKNNERLSELDHLELEIKENELEMKKLYNQIYNIKKKTNKLKEKQAFLLVNKISKDQLSLMKHTVEYKTRNWIGVEIGSQNEKDFEELEAKGYAMKLPTPEWVGDEHLYCLTNKGIEFIKNLRKLEE